MAAQLAKCTGSWSVDDTTGTVLCSGQIAPVENPPLSALDGPAVAELTTAAVLAFAVAWGFREVRRFIWR